MSSTLSGPPGYTRAQSDVPWDPKYLQLEPPARVHLLAELDESAAGPTALSPIAITTPFRLLSEEGGSILQRICTELQGVATTTLCVSKLARGIVYRSEFIRGFCFDPSMLGMLRRLAQAEAQPHPVTHHAAQLNFTPRRPFAPGGPVAPGRGGVRPGDDRLGPTAHEGWAIRVFLGQCRARQGTPAERPGAPGGPRAPGRIPRPRLGRAPAGPPGDPPGRPLEEHYPRITLVASYYAPHPEIDDPTDLATLRKVDGREIALVEWSRYAALVTARKLQRFAATQADFSRSLDEVRLALRDSIADAEQAIAEFDRTDAGRLITFEAPKGMGQG